MSESLNFWENYYSNHQIPTDESFFARFVMPFLNEGDTLFEIGCGNGRDSVFFAKQGMKVTAFDQCEKEVGFLKHNLSWSSFIILTTFYWQISELCQIDCK